MFFIRLLITNTNKNYIINNKRETNDEKNNNYNVTRYHIECVL